MSTPLNTAFQRAAELINEADALLITAGAGMGVDSGLPDFRGREGFWQAYPALGKAKIAFEEIACPQSFVQQPRLAWGFYGHRLKLYRETVPHDGFALLQLIAAGMPRGAFVFTSNVDGQFQKAGFNAKRICEVHGSIHHLQCLQGCAGDIWPAENFLPDVAIENGQLLNAPPACPHCGGMARPNVLMFGDWQWLEFRQRIQMAALECWRSGNSRMVVIELGAGDAIPTVRAYGHGCDVPLIRINLRQSAVALPRDVAIPCGAFDGVYGIADALGLIS